MAESGAVAARRVHYSWVVVGVTFLTLLVSAGMRAAPSVYLPPFQTEFGWRLETLSTAISVQLLVYGVVGPFSAGIIDRYGMRATMAGSLLTMMAGFGLTFIADAAWQLYLLWGVLLGAATGMAAMVMGAIVANRWFVERRGLVLGLLTGSAAAGQLLFLPLLAGIIEHVGWQASVLAGCAAVVVVFPVVLLFMREYPAEVGLKPYGLPPSAPEPPPPPRARPFAGAFAALGEGVQSRDFWLLGLSFFVCGESTFGIITTHFIPACLDHGIVETTAAWMLAAMGVLNIVGTTGSGWLSDRFDSRHLLFWYYGLRGLSLLFLPYAFDLDVWGLSLFGIFYGLDWIATVPPTLRLAANVFGTERAGVMYGWIVLMHQVGSAAAAAGGGLMRTAFGTYDGAFLISGALCVIAAGLVLGIGRARRPGARQVLVSAEA